ncbi:hypothetical protein AMJ85_05040 [candidate division BRC1 bacterium SM23_51]|nr:MAG: hypothetical protein AMJ85_05040 [candidate division BRC1 bacterium SM23_51]
MEIKKRERLLAVLALICFGTLAGDKLILSPLQNLWEARRERIAELEKSLNRGHALIDRDQMIKQRWRQMSQHGLPVEESVAENQVLQSMSRWSQASRLGVSSLKPRWIQEDEEDHKKLECRAAAEGSIGAIAQFLYEIERDPLALRLEEIEIAARDERGSQLTLAVRFTGLLLVGEKQ